MIGTPSQYSQSKLVGLHSPTRLDKGEYFLSIEGIGSLYVLKRGDYIIRDVFVLPEHRGKGYGQKMLEEIIAFLKPKNKKIYLYVDPANEIAVSLYKKVGFQLLKANDKHGDKFIYKA